ncbi:MAG: hypothetical protein M3464_01155 [Chloroflexota bacterium]|nr:hypothetical protein [Chloroflexota bacterium]
MGKKMTTPTTLLHTEIGTWLEGQPTDLEMEHCRQALEAATAKVAQLWAEQTATVARRGDVDRKLVGSAAADRPPLHHEVLEIDSELRVLARLIEAAEADRLRAELVALARVNAMIVAELDEIAAIAAEHMPVIRGARTPEAMAKVQPLRAEIGRLRQRVQRLEFMQAIVKIHAGRVGDDIDITNERTWEPAVTKAAAARAIRRAA